MKSSHKRIDMKEVKLSEVIERYKGSGFRYHVYGQVKVAFYCTVTTTNEKTNIFSTMEFRNPTIEKIQKRVKKKIKEIQQLSPFKIDSHKIDFDGAWWSDRDGNRVNLILE